MKLIGLTGGVACGKTTVSNLFEKSGYPVIDADVIARALLANNDEVGKLIEKEFGTRDRMKLRQIIFNDLDQRLVLEKILHPKVGDAIQDRVYELQQKKPIPHAVIISVPLLFESNWERLVDLTIAVVSQRNTQLDRLQKRDEIADDLAKKMVAAQLPNTEKANRATYVVQNDGTLKELEKSVKKLITQLEKRELKKEV